MPGSQHKDVRFPTLNQSSVSRGDSPISLTSKSTSRADRRVLPLLLLGFAVYQLDRTNIASALTGGFARIISVETNTINLGNQLMFLGVILLEIPSNMMLHKVCQCHRLLFFLFLNDPDRSSPMDKWASLCFRTCGMLANLFAQQEWISCHEINFRPH